MELLTKADLEKLPTDKLDNLIHATDQHITTLSAYQQLIHDVREKKLTVVATAAMLAKMSPGERDALAQALAAPGIASAESVSKL
jgi:hypothetical protein